MTTWPITDTTYAYVQSLRPGTRFTLGPAPQVYSVVTVTPTTLTAVRCLGAPEGAIEIGQRRWPSIRITTEETP